MTNSTWWVSKDQLDKKQQEVVGLPPEGRYFVSGPPGSGKTNLALLRAKHLQLSCVKNFLFVAYTQPLARFLRGGGQILADRLQTSVKWMQDVLYAETGRTIERKGKVEVYRRRISEEVLEYFQSSRREPIVDYLFVDELQDYFDIEVQMLGAIARNLFLVGDSDQAIYSTDLTAATIESVAPTKITLSNHYRIGRAICAVADRVKRSPAGSLLGSCMYDESLLPSDMRHEQLGLKAQIARLNDELPNQLAVYPGEPLGVMCPKNEDLDIIYSGLSDNLRRHAALQREGSWTDIDFSQTPIVVANFHATKGMEFRCVHMLSVEKLKKFGNSRNLFYTAVTRAKTSLRIYYAEDPNTFIQTALVPDPAVSAPSDLGALF